MTGQLPINVNHLLRQRTIEGDRIEYKAGWNPQKVLHTICAFANDFHPVTQQDAGQATECVDHLVVALTGEMSRAQIQAALQLRDRRHFTAAYLKPALKVGLVDVTLPDKPNSDQPALATIFQTLILG